MNTKLDKLYILKLQSNTAFASTLTLSFSLFFSLSLDFSSVIMENNQGMLFTRFILHTFLMQVSMIY